MKALVLKSMGSRYVVELDGKAEECGIRGKFRSKGIKLTNPVSVGDYVELEQLEDDQYIIVKIHPRENYLVRKSVNLSKQYHVLASNLDQAILIVTIDKPQTSLEFIDRFLVMAEVYRIPVRILINKVDLHTEKEEEKAASLKVVYERIGYPVHLMSVEEGQGMDSIEGLLKGKVSAVVGHSGVGKSSFLNRYIPDKDIYVAQISEQHQKGMHTTTFAEMFALRGGGYLVDTPGIKGLGVVDVEPNELDHYFVDFFALKSNCQFNDCVHINEPKCAVKKALEEGEIAVSRYDSYWSIFNQEEKENYR